jgi:hypothetical protein
VSALNALRWDGSPGHYEVHYLTTTEPRTGVGLWIRQTMLAPDVGEPTCAVWFMATFPDSPAVARKLTLPAAKMIAEPEPFRLLTGPAELTDEGMRGGFEDVAWDLRWAPGRGYQHVRPMLQRLGVAKTVLVLPHGDVSVTGTVTLPGRREVALDGAPGGQAHLWGSKHSSRWTWAHCGDFADADGQPSPGTFVDGVSVFVPRFGREVGPSSPVVGRLLDEDFLATSPMAVLRAASSLALTSWSLRATAGKRRIDVQVDAPRGSLVGVTYTDPDGEKAYCYNSEVASMRIAVFDRLRGGRWGLRQTLRSAGRAHFGYGQRVPVPGFELHV